MNYTSDGHQSGTIGGSLGLEVIPTDDWQLS
jgi:hypothetical protein